MGQLKKRSIVALITFHAGGRRTLPFAGERIDNACRYAPHLVVDGQSQYVGVRFIGGPIPTFDEPAQFDLELVYPNVDEPALVPGATFTLREGPTVVASGHVIAVGEGIGTETR